MKQQSFMKQQAFQKTNWDHRFCSGGELRKSRQGRGMRPLSTRDPLHLVFKVRPGELKKGLRNPATHTLVHRLLKKYSKRFYVKVEQFSVNSDHIHLLVRCSKRSFFHSFFRVFAGQIAQHATHTFRVKREGKSFWKARPWSRVIKGYKAYVLVRAYVKLNALEASGKVPYRKGRTRGLSLEQMRELWS